MLVKPGEQVSLLVPASDIACMYLEILCLTNSRCMLFVFITASGRQRRPGRDITLQVPVIKLPFLCLPQVPLDGVVAWGVANVSLQHITGESAPVRFAPGDALPAGSLNTDGVLAVRSLTSDIEILKWKIVIEKQF